MADTEQIFREERRCRYAVLTKMAAGLKNRTQQSARLLEEYLPSWATLPNRVQVKALGQLIRPKKIT
jgi:hypothetical protein